MYTCALITTTRVCAYGTWPAARNNEILTLCPAYLMPYYPKNRGRIVRGTGHRFAIDESFSRARAPTENRVSYSQSRGRTDDSFN